MDTEIREPCRIVGVLDDGPAGLDANALRHVRAAGLVIGSARTLALLAPEIDAGAETRALDGRLGEVAAWVREALDDGRRVVVLATGDPLCHGIGAYLQSRLCIEACEVLPNRSMVQLACARLGLPWQGLGIASVHGRDTGEWDAEAGPGHGLYGLLRALERHDALAVYTSPANTPDRIARLLLATGLAGDWRMAVAEHLCREDERVHAGLSIEAAAEMRFREPNLVVLWRDRPRTAPVRFGLDDADFEQRRPDKGLITKREVRAVSLARLALRADSCVWDIGAGSGAVGLEAARLCPDGRVYAIEKNPGDAAIARRNRQAMRCWNHRIVEGRAPDGLDDWPAPDAVFIGGSGGELAALIDYCLGRLRPGGRLVMNFVTFENLDQAIKTLDRCAVEWDLCQIQVARSRPILAMHRLAAENPVWIVSARTAGPEETA